MVKSKLTTVWTESTSGVARPASSREAVSYTLPVARRAAPAHGQHAVDDLGDAVLRAVAQRGQVGQQADEPEQQRHGGVGGDREHVPHQRAAELRLDAHGVGIRE